MHSQPPPKGSLEELFRHHLLESEAAAVPPRPLVWDQLDNSLLLAENEKYRRRLLVYRRSLAASLLLAALAGGGWWHQRVATATLATANARQEAARRAVTGAVAPGSRPAATATAALTAAPATGQRGAGSLVASGSSAGQVTADQAVAAAASHLAPPHAGRRGHQQPAVAVVATAGRGHANRAMAAATHAATGQLAGGQVAGALPSHTSAFSSLTASSIDATSTSSFADSSAAFAAASQFTPGAATSQPDESTSGAVATAALAAGRRAEELLAARLTALAVPPAAGLPAALALQELPAPTPTLLRRWRYSADYTIGAFQPNIDFNRTTGDYNTALGYNTVSLTRAAAAEYRANLRPGTSHRLTLRATRWLGGRWSLSTGIGVAQQEAYSATSAAFTGEQLADVASFNSNPSTMIASVPSRNLRESSFRYRSAGVPIELQYDNQAKSGLSFYGRLGAIVSALLSARSEVAGNSEATRTYSLMSASTPYRRLTALLRGSAGVRYRPAGRKWGLNVGPTAEAGVQSMNAETDRSFLQQSRPYSVGIEAGIEFGGGLKLVQ